LRGPVSSDGVDGYSSSGGTYTMKPAKLISVEFVEPGWLEAWATVFREPTSPWRIHRKPPGDKAAQIKALAPKVLGALHAMRAVAGPTAEQKQTVHAIDADTKVVTAFRVRTEQSIQRWLVQVNDDYEIGLDGLGELGPLPPTTVEIQRWFLDAEAKAAFLEKVRSVWKGGLDALILAHYVRDGNHTSWTEAALDVVQGWDAATYALRRKTTMDILDG
jgi:hypothetical protein